MKKLFALFLALMMVVSMATVVSAENTTILTTTVPAAAYTLNIPADQEIPFGATSTDIGNVTVTNSAGFAEGKNLNVTLSYSAFTCQDTATTIPITLSRTAHRDTYGGQSGTFDIPNGSTLVFYGNAEGSVRDISKSGEYIMDTLNVNVLSEDWGMALAGDYSTTITFTAEVVVEE